MVFKHKTDPTKVVKVYKPTEGGYKTLDELREGLRMYRARDEVPGAVPTELQGYLQGENGMYPVFTQTKVGPIKKMSVLDELARMFEGLELMIHPIRTPRLQSEILPQRM